MHVLLMILSIIGFCASLYGYFVEQKLKNNARYKPVCDLNSEISCTKPMLSPYGKLFGFSNNILGLFFYPFLILFNFFNLYTLLFISSAISALFTLYLAYLLIFKIKSLCMICVTIYIVNGLLFIISYYTL